MQRIKLFVFTLILVSLLAACSAPQADSGDAQITLVDTAGNEVVLDKAPERIVVSGKATPYVLDTIYLFPEAPQRLTGVEVRSADTQEFLRLVDPDIEVKNLLEFGAGPEQIAPLNPDLMILKNWSMKSLGTAMAEIGIPSVGLNLETPDVFYEDIRLLGKIFNNDAHAEEIVTFYQDRVKMVEDEIATLDKSEKPSVLVLQYIADGSEIAFNVPPKSYLQTLMVEMAGGEPVWLDEIGSGDNWMVVGFEQIAAWNADMIFVVNYKGDSTEAAASLAENPDWQALTAVQNGNLFAYPADYASWDLIDPRWILGLEWQAAAINPELAGKINIKQAVVDFYSTLYGLSETQINDHVFPKLSELDN